MANNFKIYTSAGIGTANTKVGSYTVGANTQTTIIGMTLANIVANGTPITASVFVNNGTANTYLVRGAPIPAGGSLVVVGGDQKIVLTSGYSVYVNSSVASSVDVILSVLEIT